MTQHVIQRGNNRSAIFVAASDHRFFRDCLREACEHHRCQVHAYVLMTNHVHLLVTPMTASGIAQAYRALFGEELSDSTLAEIRDATNRGWALGSKRFRDEIATLLARRVEPARPCRRPRRNDVNRL